LIQSDQFKETGMVPPLNVRNEARVLRIVATACEQALTKYDTTIQEDNKFLEVPKSLNHRNSLLMRRGEKEVLEAYIDLARHINTVENFTLVQLHGYLEKNIPVNSKQGTIEWRREKFFEELWVPLVTGIKKKLEEWNNSLVS